MTRQLIARMAPRTSLRLLLLVAVLIPALSIGIAARPSQAHASNVCAWTLTPVDTAPGNWWEEHHKFLYANGTSQDLTYLFNTGQLLISFSDRNYNVLGTADRNSWWIGAQTKNQWGISTRWTWTHQDFTSYHWMALWNC